MLQDSSCRQEESKRRQEEREANEQRAVEGLKRRQEERKDMHAHREAEESRQAGYMQLMLLAYAPKPLRDTSLDPK